MIIQIDGKEVAIQAKDKWTYDGVRSDKIQAINSALFIRVQKEVEYSLDNRQKIEAEKLLKAKHERFEARMQKFNTLKSEVETILKAKNFDITKAKFHTPNIQDYSWDFLVSFGYDIYLYYDNKVYGKTLFSGAHTTKLVWKVEINYRKKRYITLEKAIDYVIKRREALILQVEQKKESLALKAEAEKAMQSFATENGFIFEKHYTSPTYCMRKGNVVATLSYDYILKKVKIDSYTITKQGIQIEDLKTMAEGTK